MIQELTFNEKLLINGGHDGVAYEAGKSFGEFVRKAGTLLGIAALFFMPKS